MKKLLAIALVVCSFVSVSFAGGSTPLKISLFPKLGLPTNQVVHGVDLGIIATKPEEVQGIQLGWIYAGTSKKMVGLQDGFVASSENMVGLQWGFVCLATEMKGIQIGFINVSDKMQGVQIGLVNVIKTGIIPAMVVVNASF
ncbi:MAG: hypothetical protein A2252_01580 [Elusimicrobia bacterium RIFOXYA2_FULL_39_19]|nr:MAG: hypothetical protein A2252_01580 [Elusimicrobia bacterium RIFOXYA2_FULL_39_19]